MASWFWWLLPLVHLAGLAAAAHAVLTARTPSAAIAWGLGLVTFPYLGLPLYLTVGRDRFNGYVQAVRAGTLGHDHPEVSQFLAAMAAHRHAPAPEQAEPVRVLERLARIPFTEPCHVELLVDGEATYARMLAEIDAARDYVLVEFFIVNDDGAGRALQAAMIRKAREGVQVLFVYDEMGSQAIEGAYVRELREAGVDARPFYTTRGFWNQLQLNFRNHRKIVVADGRVALVGGLNVGDEYLGKSRHYGPWRDTHTAVRGPAVMGVQMVFCEDWFWATGGEVPDNLRWEPEAAPEGGMAATYLASGPSDATDVAVLFLMECITAAQKRLWLASPYFVPDPSIVDALKLAALRGVDVRILVPPGRFEYHMFLAALSYIPELQGTGISLFVYPGYNHSKVMLVDDWLAWVGSANLDNRSLRLNFEGNLLVAGRTFAEQVAEMLRRDFARARPLHLRDLNRVPVLTHLLSRFVRLFSPIL